MKRMLDELKKLDKEYMAPADFKGKVMQQVRLIQKEKEQSNKIVDFFSHRYVIASLALAAVILIACVISVKNGRVATQKLNNSNLDTVMTNDSPIIASSQLGLESDEEEANVIMPEEVFTRRNA